MKCRHALNHGCYRPGFTPTCYDAARRWQSGEPLVSCHQNKRPHGTGVPTAGAFPVRPSYARHLLWQLVTSSLRTCAPGIRPVPAPIAAPELGRALPEPGPVAHVALKSDGDIWNKTN